MQILKEIAGNEWKRNYPQETRQEAIAALEQDKILLLPELIFDVLPIEQAFFSTGFANPKFKNISFDNKTDLMRGAKCEGNQYNHLKAMLKRYAEHATGLIHHLLPAYTPAIQIGRTSFRPIEIYGRTPKSFRKDDTRLHVDAFPVNPTQGKRIMRVFTNINPHGTPRVWRVGEPFIDVVKQFLPTVKKPWYGRSRILNALGLTRSYCTEYDYIMLQLHNNMKEDLHYQKTAQQTEVRFKANTTWIVQTDSVSHAAMSGQYVLEQTFYLPVSAMLNPQFSPLRILEKLKDKTLV